MPQEHETAIPAPPEQRPSGDLARRGLLLSAGVVGVAGLAAACGDSDSEGGKPSATATPTDNGGMTMSSGGGVVLGDAAEVPVGGGKVFKDRKVVVTQPEPGEYRAFTAVCTHRGCTVASVANGLIRCPCHGSEFRIDDGRVARPPAGKALVEQAIKVSGGKIILT
ncbi:Rieske (2Fe-2S) protein [Spirillospora sp. NPDC049652]